VSHAHLIEHLPVAIDGALEKREKFLLERHVMPEAIEGFRRCHRSFIMPAHREVPVSSHLVGGCLQLAGEVPMGACQVHVRVMFLSSILVVEVECLLMDLEDCRRRRRQPREQGGKGGKHREAFAACWSIVHGSLCPEWLLESFETLAAQYRSSWPIREMT
jgi:hypothetical protein